MERGWEIERGIKLKNRGWAWRKRQGERANILKL